MSQETGFPESDHQRACLQLLEDIFEISTALATRTYIWGGMVVDILRGQFLRAHHDIDGFTLNLLNVNAEMAELFAERGYVTAYSDEYDMLKIRKGEFHAGLNRLEVDGHTAMWRHVGDQGTVYFPVDWLDLTPRCFYDVNAYVSGVKFEYAIKTNVHLLNPEWQLRDKDRSAIKFLRAELDSTGVDKAEVLSRIRSYTPYWVGRGYPEYESLIMARCCAV